MLEEIIMRKLLLIFISFIVVFPVLAQEENLYQIVTPYEKARESASEIWLKDFSENATPQELLSLGLIGVLELKDKEDEIEKMEAKESLICTFCGLSEIITPNTWDDYKYKQKLTPICKKYVELIAEAQKLKSDEDIEREKKRNSPMGLLKKKCNQDFSKWAVKSEFEKNIEWSNRIQSKGNFKFDSICSSYYLSSWHNAKPAFNNYDAETESFSLTLTYYNQGKEVSSLTGYCVVKDNPQFAKKFLKDHESYINSFDCEGKLMNVNGYIYPKRVTIGNTYTFIFPIPDNAQDVVVCNNITGYCFDSQRWKKISDSLQYLQHITDSLEILRKNVNIKKSQLLDSLKLYRYFSSDSSYKRYCNVYKEILEDKNGYDLMGADTAFTNMVPRILLEHYGALQYLFENQSEFYQFFKTFYSHPNPSVVFRQLKEMSIQRLQEKLKESNLKDGSELHNNPSHPLAKEIVSYINAIRFYDKMGVIKEKIRRSPFFGFTYEEYADIIVLHDWADNYKYLRKGIKQSYREDYGLYVFDFFLEYINGN